MVVGTPVGHVLHTAVDHRDQQGMLVAGFFLQFLFGLGIDLGFHRHNGQIANGDDLAAELHIPVGLVFQLFSGLHGEGCRLLLCQQGGAIAGIHSRCFIRTHRCFRDTDGCLCHFLTQICHDLIALFHAQIHTANAAVAADLFVEGLLPGHLIASRTHTEQAGRIKMLFHQGAGTTGNIRRNHPGLGAEACHVDGTGLQAVAD